MIPETIARKLQKLVNDNLDALHVFRALGTKERTVKVTDLYRVKLMVMRSGIHLGSDDLDTFGHKLETIGVGKLKSQKLPKHSVFVWRYAIDEVVKVALAGVRRSESPQRPLAGSRSDAAGDGHPTPQRAASNRSDGDAAGQVRVLCPLRNDALSISLPRDFNRRDAEQIARYLARAAELNERGEL